MNYRIKECQAFNPMLTDGETRHALPLDCQDFVTYYVVQKRRLGFWLNIKTFANADIEYARNCAEELLEKLEEEI